ncbi:hypothetical protein DZS_29250 [Dickeya ananatis]
MRLDLTSILGGNVIPIRHRPHTRSSWQRESAVAITEAYFLHAKNIGKADVLADIAISYGFERDEALAIAHDQTWHERVAQAAADSAAAGVQSVPYFVFGTHVAINGSRSEDEITAAIVNCSP